MLLYTDKTTDADTGETTKNLVPLCRSFDVDFTPSKKDNKTGAFGCSAELNETMCDREVIVVLEVWLLTGRLLQASSKMAIDCTAKSSDEATVADVVDGVDVDVDEDEDDDVPSTPLVLSPSVVARSCSWSEWSEWSDCPITCGDKPGRRTRTRGQT